MEHSLAATRAPSATVHTLPSSTTPGAAGGAHQAGGHRAQQGQGGGISGRPRRCVALHAAHTPAAPAAGGARQAVGTGVCMRVCRGWLIERRLVTGMWCLHMPGQHLLLLFPQPPTHCTTLLHGFTCSSGHGAAHRLPAAPGGGASARRLRCAGGQFCVRCGQHASAGAALHAGLGAQ